MRVEIPLVFVALANLVENARRLVCFIYISCCVGGTHRTPRVEPKVQDCSGVLCSGIFA